MKSRFYLISKFTVITMYEETGQALHCSTKAFCCVPRLDDRQQTRHGILFGKIHVYCITLFVVYGPYKLAV